MITDKARLLRTAAAIRVDFNKDDLETLEHMVGKTQNSCSQDGTVKDPLWTDARDLARAARQLLAAIQRLEEASFDQR